MEELLLYKFAAWSVNEEEARREAKVRQWTVAAAWPGGEAL
jgi:hypothetical protein